MQARELASDRVGSDVAESTVMKITSLVAVSLLVGSTAYADDNLPSLLEVNGVDIFDHHVAAPANAIEIGFASGYTRGVGPIGGGMQRLEDISKAGGGAVELDAMYRIDPTVAVGVYFSLSKYDASGQADAQTDVFGATAGLQAVAHLRPSRSVDPWVSLGAGWRNLTLSSRPSPDASLQGLELARVQLGVDYRVSEDVAIAPVVGGSLNLFVSEESPGDFMEIADKKTSFVGFAGIAGRFDVGGTR
jgi:hypothetical protein